MTADTQSRVSQPVKDMLIEGPTRPEDMPTVVEPPQMPATVQPHTVEEIIFHAVQSGMTADSLEKLVGLAERMKDRQAEQAFNTAFAKFRRACPIIVKDSSASFPTKSGGTMSYRFATLAHICNTVELPLSENGFIYTWDCEEDQKGRLVTTCTLRHVEGHKLSAKFAVKPDGTVSMSEAQKTGSANTFAKRYSLLGVLGLPTDDDDDAKKAEPMPQPEPDATAPKAPPRAERPKEGQGQAPTYSPTRMIYERWAKATKADKSQGVAVFTAWANKELSRPADKPLGKDFPATPAEIIVMENALILMEERAGK